MSMPKLIIHRHLCRLQGFASTVQLTKLMAAPTLLIALKLWHGQDLPSYNKRRETMLMAPLNVRQLANVQVILMSALLRLTARSFMSTPQSRADDQLLAAGFLLDMWTATWIANSPLLPPCDFCALPTGGWCDRCDSTQIPLCSECDDTGKCRHCD